MKILFFLTMMLIFNGAIICGDFETHELTKISGHQLVIHIYLILL